ncbi:MAG TPA: DUF2769 domain-containing protein [Coriobacteriia bacterium]|jgi:hypothetical protein
MDLQEAADLCTCPECPSYFDCGESLAFCLYQEGKSSCIQVERGCICPGCPVYAAEDLKFHFYCTRGSEKALAGS